MPDPPYLPYHTCTHMHIYTHYVYFHRSGSLFSANSLLLLPDRSRLPTYSYISFCNSDNVIYHNSYNCFTSTYIIHSFTNGYQVLYNHYDNSTLQCNRQFIIFYHSFTNGCQVLHSHYDNSTLQCNRQCN